MWTIEKITNWYQAQPWLVGFNYVTSNAVNSTEMWQNDTFDSQQIERELRAANELGYNTLRVFLQFWVYHNETELFLKNFDRFLEIADHYGLSVMPVLFDDCAFSNLEPYLGKQRPPVKGIHNSGWTPSPGFVASDNSEMRPALQKYVIDMLSRYRDDRRVILWDMYNEAGNSGRKEACLPLLEECFCWARTVNPSQPLTSCVWCWEGYDSEAAKLSDIISFHDYTDIENTRKRVEGLKEYARPIICTEWLHRLANNRIETHMEYYRQEGIGIYNWGLIKGKTQTHLSWNPADNNCDGSPHIWQHDLLDENLVPYIQKEVLFFNRTVTEKPKTGAPMKLTVPVTDMTPSIMQQLEDNGIIIRICPGHHRFPINKGEGVGQDIYRSDSQLGGHKLISVVIDRTSFSAFGVHDGNEEFLLLGGVGEKPMYLMIGLHTADALEQKAERHELAPDDFVCLRCKFNDPEVSFFTMKSGVPHGEACAPTNDPAASFYVTESCNMNLITTALGDYELCAQ